MSYIPKVVDRSATKPIYLLVAEDPTEKGNIAYYKVKDLNDNNPSMVDIKGYKLNKTKANELVKNPNATVSAEAVNVKIPLHRIISIRNTIYKEKSQGEKNE